MKEKSKKKMDKIGEEAEALHISFQSKVDELEAAQHEQNDLTDRISDA